MSTYIYNEKLSYRVLKWTYVNRDRLKIVESDVDLTLTYIDFVKWSEKQEQ